MFRNAPSQAAGGGPVHSALNRTTDNRLAHSQAFSNLERGKKEESDNSLLPKGRKPWRSVTTGTANVEQAPRSPAAAGRKLTTNAELAFGPTHSQKSNPGRSVAPKTSFKRQVVVEQPFAPTSSQRGPGARADKRTLSRSVDREASAGKRDYRRTLTCPAQAPLETPGGSACPSAYASEEEMIADDSRFIRQTTAPAAPEEIDFQAVFSSPQDAEALEEEITKDFAEFSKIMCSKSPSSDPRQMLAACTSPGSSCGVPFGSSSSDSTRLPGTESTGFDALGVEMPRRGSKESPRPSSQCSGSEMVGERGSNTAAAAAANNMLQRLSGSEAAPLPAGGPQTQKSKGSTGWNSSWLGTAASQRNQKKSSMWSAARGSFMVSKALSNPTPRSASSHSASTASGTGSASSEDAVWVSMSTPRGSGTQVKPPAQASMKEQKGSQEAKVAATPDSQTLKQFGTDSDDLQNRRRSADDLDRELEEVLSGLGGDMIALGNTEGDETFAEDILTTLQVPAETGNAADKALDRLANWAGGALPQEEEFLQSKNNRDRRKSYADAMGSTMSRVRHKLAAVKNQFLMSSVAEDAKEHLARERLALNSETRSNGKKRMGWS